MRLAVTLALVAAGFALQAISYFALAAKIGVPTSPAFSNPRVHYAPLIFIAGVVLVFLAAVFYELLPERRDDG
jgi:uncharacterized membrane protein YidH (DUF202 family)